MSDNSLVPYFDLAEICKFIEYSDNTKVKETEIIINTDSFDGSVEGGINQVLNNKTVRDNIPGTNSKHTFKPLISTLPSPCRTRRHGRGRTDPGCRRFSVP